MTADLDRLERVAHRMDSLFRIPGTRIRVGFDSILGLVPGVGDALALAPAGYIIHQGWRMGASRRVLGRMVWNTGVDALLGSIPLIGDIFDVGNKANRKNVALLRAHLAETKRAPEPAPSRRLANG